MQIAECGVYQEKAANKLMQYEHIRAFHEKFSFFLFFFFDSVLRPFQDYYSSYETGQSEGWAKTGEPREKNTWHTSKQNLACLTCGQSGAQTHTRHSGETIE